MKKLRWRIELEVMVLYGICRQEKKRKRRRKVGNVSDIQTDQLLASTEMKVVCFYKDCVVASVRRGGITR